jgi:hypothetical protein
MSGRRRDRHGRGIRGPLALTNPLTRHRAQPPHPTNRADFFSDAVQATAERPGQIVVDRRPLEHRAATRRGLRILVYRTIVEQLSALTGRSVDEIDPDGAGSADD